jgi:hypothetical protein
MTGNRHNHEGDSDDSGEPDPDPYWKRIYRDWRFWIGAILTFAPIPFYILVAIWHEFRMVAGFPKPQVDYQQPVSGGSSCDGH